MMQKVKKIVILITIFISINILFFNFNVQATNNEIKLQKVEYTDEFKKWLELSDEQKKHVMQPRMYDLESTSISSRNPFYRIRLVGAGLTTRYSLKEKIGENVAIRNQQNTNSCWAFAALSSLETNMAMQDQKTGENTNKVYDYSERHMEYATSKTFKDGVQNPMGYNRSVGEGGQWYLAESYLTNGSGAIEEAQMPFVNNEQQIDISGIQNKTIATQVYDTIDFDNYATQTAEKKTETMNKIKQHIQTYGAVYATIHGNTSSTTEYSCYNNDTGAKYCNDEETHLTDHAVSIIGWDDEYSIEKFAENAKPTNKGAWIVRNSWGEKLEYPLAELKDLIFQANQEACEQRGWHQGSDIPDAQILAQGYTIENGNAYKTIGDNGFIYVSYEDCNVSKTLFGIEKANDHVDYENIYQYDVYYPATVLALTVPQIMLCNVFDKQTTGTEYLTQVALYAPETYTCKVYVNPNGESNAKENLQAVPLKAGETETIGKGYHTLEFAEPMEITGNKFAVVVQIQGTNSNTVAVSLETKVTGVPSFDAVNTQTQKCFWAPGNQLDNCTWEDLGNLSQSSIGTDLPNADSTIKAFTVSERQDGALKNIEIVTPPNKTTYQEGENFDSTGMVVKANYYSNTNPSVTLQNTQYTIPDGKNLRAGQTSVTIAYEDKTVTQTIQVEKNKAEETTKTVAEIKVTKAPNTTKYFVGDNFDATGMVVTATYQDGTKQEITNYTIENGTALKKGQTSVTIKYEGKTTTQAITVEEKAVNSNLTNAKMDVKKVEAYLTEDLISSYALVQVEINDITRNMENDSVEYYYYLSGDANEKDISKWTKITEAQNANDKLQFTIDSRNVPNILEIANEEVLYLYVKEVAKKGDNQSEVISKAMKVDTDAAIDIHMVNAEKQNAQSGNTLGGTNGTGTTGTGANGSSVSQTSSTQGGANTANKATTVAKLPYAGHTITMVLIMIAILGMGIFGYVRYKQLSKYIK